MRACVYRIADGKVIILNLLFRSLRIVVLEIVLETVSNSYIVDIIFITRTLDVIFDKFIFQWNGSSRI